MLCLCPCNSSVGSTVRCNWAFICWFDSSFWVSYGLAHVEPCNCITKVVGILSHGLLTSIAGVVFSNLGRNTFNLHWGLSDSDWLAVGSCFALLCLHTIFLPPIHDHCDSHTVLDSRAWRTSLSFWCIWENQTSDSLTLFPKPRFVICPNTTSAREI